MNHRETTFRGAGGLELFSQRWRPDDGPRAAVAVVHGLGEHSGRYGFMVAHLVARGYAVHAFDLRGHGRSPGQRGHVGAWSEHRDDVDAFLRTIRGEESGLPLFLLGHSMGGLIVLDYVLRRPDAVVGAVVSGPGLEPVGVASPFKVAVAKLLSRFWPRFSLDLQLDCTAVSRDPEVVSAYRDDPLRHSLGSARWGTESLEAIVWIKAHAGDVRTPLLMVHGGDDRLVSPAGTRKFFDRVSFPDKELHVYEGGYHEPHNDVDRDRYLDHLSGWLDRHL